MLPLYVTYFLTPFSSENLGLFHAFKIDIHLSESIACNI
jgi:hypothetical protein